MVMDMSLDEKWVQKEIVIQNVGWGGEVGFSCFLS